MCPAVEQEMTGEASEAKQAARCNAQYGCVTFALLVHFKLDSRFVDWQVPSMVSRAEC